MADFIDSEAEESEEEIINRKRKIEDDDEEEEEDDEEEEEEDEEKLREEMKDLICDDEEEDEEKNESSDEEVGRKKRKRRADYDDDLEEDEYALLEENLGTKVQRKKKFKRLKRPYDEESDNEETQESGGGVDAREAIANVLFEGDDAEGEASVRDAEEEAQYGDEESEGESDENDFVVDDDGQPITKGKNSRRSRYSDAALQEAHEIFGVDFDYADFKQYGDDYEEDLEEEEEEGGEPRPKQKRTECKRQTKKSIYDIFEPSELERSHFTDLDNDIRAADIPERFQLLAVPVTDCKEEELDEESQWIYKQAFSNPTISVQEGEQGGGHQPIAGRKGPTAVGKIRDAVNCMRNLKYEVPFIAFYRKEYVEPDLNINDLWTVYKWDEKWCQLHQRKSNLLRLFEKMLQYQCNEATKDPDRPLVEGFRSLENADIQMLKDAQTAEEVADCYWHFILHYGQDLTPMKEALQRKQREEALEKESEGQEPPEPDPDTKVKHKFHKDAYVVCKEIGLDALARRFGLTPEQFGENLRDNYQRHEVEQCPVEPLEVAADFVTKRFPTPEDALRAARYMVATQISREPVVRKCVRQTFFERAKLCVKPTKNGIKEVDENHPCYSVKYIKDKPVGDLYGDQFLKLDMAERAGLLTYSITMDRDGAGDGQTYLDEIKQLYERDDFSKNVQEWNRERCHALEMALMKDLYPALEKELKMRLLSEAREGIVKASCRKLYNWLKVAPYQVDPQVEEDEDFDTKDGIRVLAIAYASSMDTPAFSAMIDGDGQVMEYLRLPHIMKRRNAWNKKDRILKAEDLKNLKILISKRKPHVIAVGGESRDAIMIMEDVKTAISELMDSDQLPPIPVELVDNELGILYMNSKKGENDFRDYPPLLRQAISLARRIQDPLIEFSQLCTPDKEILCMKYHSLQDEIDKDELLNSLYLQFINRTNEVGVDINRCINFPHTAGLVQFLCGLGPRKGGALIKIIKAHQQLESRTQLVTLCHMGPDVFVNCAGFIKIDTLALVDNTETYAKLFDGSRVHPEDYPLARQMVVDALEYEDQGEPAGALEEIIENPEKLSSIKDLDLDAFAEELERQGFGKKSITLYDIRAELNHNYKDLRTPYRSPNAEEVFSMLTKETPQTFYIGKLVTATVTGIARRKLKGEQLDKANPMRNCESGYWQCPFCMKRDFPELSDVWNHFDAGSCPGQAMGVRTRLDNGISGFIHTKFISDKYVTNPEERVKHGMIIHARIMKIDVEKFSVDLTSRSSDLADKNSEWKPAKDVYYDHEAKKTDYKTEEEEQKKQSRQVYLKRVIVHPSFHNIGFQEAEELLETMEQGEVVVRPSSKGNNHLTVTWKFADGINQHIDVLEEGKENAFSLGRSLIIGSEQFEDIDEIIARHIQPMASFARDVLNFKYCISADGGRKEAMEKILMDEKKKAPSKIHYYIAASAEFRGKFLLSYLPRTQVKHEYVTVLPEGYKYRGRVLRSVNSLFRWFKEHFRDPVPETPAAMSARTTVGQSSYIGATPSIKIANVDPQAIQRAAANLPSHVYNTLSQVTGQKPSFQKVGNFTAGYRGAYNYQPDTPSQQIATPLVTPSYHHVPTPAQSQVPTPRYPQTSQNSTWVPPAPQTSQNSTWVPSAPQTPTQVSQMAARLSNPNPSAADWQRMAEQWAKKRQQETLVPVQMTPRTSIRGSPSPMIESTPADTTPLIDEF